MTRRVGSTELKHTGYEIFIMALTVLSIVNLVLVTLIDSMSLSTVVLSVNAVLSVVLFLDFVYRFATAESRSTYFFRDFGWADLLASLPLAHLKVLRVFRLVRVWRFVRALGWREIFRTLAHSRAGTALFLLLLVAILMWEFGSLAILHLESSDPDRNIQTASDALWYLLVTMSTVGYGDHFPVSNEGRVLGVVIIVTGVGIFGTLTGFLANAFLSGPEDAAQDAVPGVAEDVADAGTVADQPLASAATPLPGEDTLRAELQALRAQHQEAIDRLDQLLAPRE